jgi:hypothetical protein
MQVDDFVATTLEQIVDGVRAQAAADQHAPVSTAGSRRAGRSPLTK